MAIDIATEYANAVTSSANYPGGSFKNEVTPGVSGDGTPVEKEWANDWLGFLLKLQNDANITSSGAADTRLASDRFDGLMALCGYNPSMEDSGSANTYQVSPFKSGQVIDEYYDGQLVEFMATNDNSGASTLRVGSLAAKDLIYETGRALVGGEIRANQRVTARYDAGLDDFILMNPNPNLFDGTPVLVSGVATEGDLCTIALPRDVHLIYKGFRVVALANKIDNGGGGTQIIRFYVGTSSFSFGNFESAVNDNEYQIVAEFLFDQSSPYTGHSSILSYSTWLPTGYPAATDYRAPVAFSHDFTAAGATVKFTGQSSNATNSIGMTWMRLNLF